jgi:hypothetical protein
MVTSLKLWTCDARLVLAAGFEAGDIYIFDVMEAGKCISDIPAVHQDPGK